MDGAAKVGLGVAGGYLLGRRHKLRYAIGLGAWMVGRRVPLSPRAMVREGVDLARRDPEVMDLVDELRDTVLGVGRRAARAVVDDRAASLTGRLRDGAGGRDDEAYPEDATEDETPSGSRRRARSRAGEEE